MKAIVSSGPPISMALSARGTIGPSFSPAGFMFV